MNILLKPLIRNAGRAVGAGAGLVIAALAIDAAHVAAAQGRLEAEYTASLAGIPIGRGNWVIEISEDQFTATATGGTFGILRVFNPRPRHQRLAGRRERRTAGADDLCRHHHQRQADR